MECSGCFSKRNQESPKPILHSESQCTETRLLLFVWLINVIIFCMGTESKNRRSPAYNPSITSNLGTSSPSSLSLAMGHNWDTTGIHIFCVLLCLLCQPVINELKEYPDWRVLYTENPRVTTSKSMAEFEREVGPQSLLETSLVNLMISAQCDYFVGTLKSHWSRLINELRLTNGRVNAGYIALRFGEW